MTTTYLMPAVFESSNTYRPGSFSSTPHSSLSADGDGDDAASIAPLIPDRNPRRNPNWYSASMYTASVYSDDDQDVSLFPAMGLMQEPTWRASKRVSAMTVPKSTGHSLLPIECTVPKTYTDESIIAVSVRLEDLPRRRSLSSKLTPGSRANPTSRFVIAQMPRGEYLKYFAKDKEGNYTGTEPQRIWTEEEVKEKYGKFSTMQPKPIFKLRSKSSSDNTGGPR